MSGRDVPLRAAEVKRRTLPLPGPRIWIGSRVMDANAIEGPGGRRLAVRRSPGAGPEICFLAGFGSDMEGTKALHLDGWARARGRGFCRFDYSGHGASSGDFLDGCIGDWADDAAAVVFATPGRKLLVGSSMGGWIALLLARQHPDRVAGLVGIAAAPDFTDARPPWPPRSPAEAAELVRDGRITLPNPYGAEPTVMTARLIEDGARQTVLRAPLDLPMPVHLLQGTGDADVPPAVALDLLEHTRAPDLRLTLLKGADHRFSSPAALKLIETVLEDMLGRIGGG
jgi:pimeloyl-ACP methyl ester carboxylesterase